MSLQPRTKEAVFSAMRFAVENFGGFFEAAKALTINELRFSSVIDEKCDVPPQWVDAFIAYGQGHVGAHGFKVVRNKYLESINVAKSTKSRAGIMKRSGSTNKLIRIGGQLRLLPKETPLPAGAVYVSVVAGSSVYLDGKLKAKYQSMAMCEKSI
jgi:hypothetical protein